MAPVIPCSEGPQKPVLSWYLLTPVPGGTGPLSLQTRVSGFNWRLQNEEKQRKASMQEEKCSGKRVWATVLVVSCYNRQRRKLNKEANYQPRAHVEQNYKPKYKPLALIKITACLPGQHSCLQGARGYPGEEGRKDKGKVTPNSPSLHRLGH